MVTAEVVLERLGLRGKDRILAADIKSESQDALINIYTGLSCTILISQDRIVTSVFFSKDPVVKSIDKSS